MTPVWIMVIVAVLAILQTVYYNRCGLRKVTYDRHFSRERAFEGEKSILDRFINNDPLAELESVASGSELIDAQASCSAVQVSDPVRYYIVALTEATRTPAEVSLGVSPRGMLWMLKAAQAWAAVHGRDYVLPDDVKKLAAPVFAHRLVTRSGYGAAERSEELIRELTRAVPVPSEDPAAEKLLES